MKWLGYTSRGCGLANRMLSYLSYDEWPNVYDDLVTFICTCVYVGNQWLKIFLSWNDNAKAEHDFHIEDYLMICKLLLYYVSHKGHMHTSMPYV